MDLVQYVKILKYDIRSREHGLVALKKHIKTPDLDPLYRLEWGKLLAIVAVYKDLADMCGIDLADDFYPDTTSILEEGQD